MDIYIVFHRKFGVSERRVLKEFGNPYVIFTMEERLPVPITRIYIYVFLIMTAVPDVISPLDSSRSTTGEISHRASR